MIWLDFVISEVLFRSQVMLAKPHETVTTNDWAQRLLSKVNHSALEQQRNQP